MTRAEFETRLSDAQQRMAGEWEQAWRERRHGELYVGAYFSGGVPGDLVVTSEKRYRGRAHQEANERAG